MLDQYEKTDFAFNGIERVVYRRGTGPGVIVMHEVPGIHPTVVRFADWVVDAGFTVIMPEFMGTAGKPATPAYAVSSLVSACIRREFHVLAANHSSPITDWLRALCRETHATLGGPGVGAIGMCLTGNFALSLMMEPCMLAPVLSQPSLPFPLGAERRAALHMSPQELVAAKERVADGACILGLRFTGDPMCPPERFETLRREFGDGFEGIEIDSAVCPHSENPSGPHSVVTQDLIDEVGHPTAQARDRVLEFFRERLQPSQTPVDS